MIKIISKENCSKCEAAKKKLRILGLTYLEYSDSVLKKGEELPISELRDAMVEYVESDTLPIFIIDGLVMSYPKAMKFLKGAEFKGVEPKGVNNEI